MTKLKQCPHCGGEVARAWIADRDALQCDKCGIVTIMLQSSIEGEKLIEVFNTRTPEIVRCGECEHYQEDDISGQCGFCIYEERSFGENEERS
ncbi:hypothetical protein [Eubacterium limosum]|uniref:hypothetical protein n=1 Tax=Eubacterium limosum TaxID=1736 RepID=UPI001063A6C0|nr:hypothetical protein [Eubacterium limosum]